MAVEVVPYPLTAFDKNNATYIDNNSFRSGFKYSLAVARIIAEIVTLLHIANVETTERWRADNGD